MEQPGKISGSFQAIQASTKKHPALATIAAIAGIVASVQGFGTVQGFLDSRYQTREEAAILQATNAEFLRRLDRIENKIDILQGVAK